MIDNNGLKFWRTFFAICQKVERGGCKPKAVVVDGVNGVGALKLGEIIDFLFALIESRTERKSRVLSEE
ncbi:hypothetical protein V6N13_058650 [Hibiscus sabdariffa]